MPNYCSNTLVIAGEPEAVEEFRIVQAQHTEPVENEDLTQSITGSAQGPDGVGMLVVDRHPNDLSFAALVRDWGEDAWGTGTDVAGDSKHERHDRGGWRLPSGDAFFDRLQSWNFTTVWAPPKHWLQAVAPQFPGLAFELGYSEPGTNQVGIASAKGSSWSLQSLVGVADAKPEVIAMANARRAMAMHRKPSKLLKAVWSDDVTSVGSFLRQSRRLGSKASVLGLDIAMESPWTALMHAAYAGSQNVAALLLKEGASPLSTNACLGLPRVGFADICMDVNGHDSRQLVCARQSMFLQALAIHPALGCAPLASGRLPLALALRYQMDELIGPLVQASPLLLSELSSAGKNAHDSPRLIVESFLRHTNTAAVGRLLDKVDPAAAIQFGSSMVGPLLEATATPRGPIARGDQAKIAAGVLGELASRGCVRPEQWRMATGEDPVVTPDGQPPQYVGDEFRAMAAAVRAKAAMADIAKMARIKKPSHT